MRRTCKRKPRQGGFFLLPNEIFTLGLSAGEIAVYAYLIFCEDRKTHQCWPGIGKICQHTGMGANTVAKYIRQLEDKQLIDVEPTKVRTKSGEVRNGHHPSYPGGGELQAGEGLVSPAKPKAHQKKKVRAKLGPVRRFVAGQRAG